MIGSYCPRHTSTMSCRCSVMFVWEKFSKVFIFPHRADLSIRCSAESVSLSSWETLTSKIIVTMNERAPVNNRTNFRIFIDTDNNEQSYSIPIWHVNTDTKFHNRSNILYMLLITIKYTYNFTVNNLYQSCDITENIRLKLNFIRR